MDVAKFSARFIARGPEECWIWTAARSGHGYGQMWAGGRVQYAHRLAWVLAYGEVPVGLHVLHCCDTPACVNPAQPVRRGEEVHNARFTTAQVRAIRARYEAGGVTYREIATEFGVDSTTIGLIVRRVTYGTV